MTIRDRLKNLSTTLKAVRKGAKADRLRKRLKAKRAAKKVSEVGKIKHLAARRAAFKQTGGTGK